MASYVFHNMVTNKRTRDYIAQKLCRKSLHEGINLREEELDMALQYCDRELFG